MNKYKNIQSGFLLQKDVYTTNLLYEHNKFPLIPNKYTFPFRKIDYYQRINIDLRNSFQIFSLKNEKNKEPKINYHKLKFPLPKSESATKIDFYSHLRGNIKIRYMVDDLNIISRKGRKIFYSIKDDDSKLIFGENEIKIDDSSKNMNKSQSISPKKKGNSFIYNKFFNIRKNIELINMHLKELNKKKKIIIRDSVFKTQIKQ